jgi:hypothetical protein
MGLIPVDKDWEFGLDRVNVHEEMAGSASARFAAAAAFRSLIP